MGATTVKYIHTGLLDFVEYKQLNSISLLAVFLEGSSCPTARSYFNRPFVYLR